MRIQTIKMLRKPEKRALLQADLPIFVTGRQESQISKIREG